MRTRERIAARYAVALAEALEPDRLEQARGQLGRFVDALRAERSLWDMLQTGRLGRREKKELVARIARTMGLDPALQRFLCYLADKRRLKVADEIARQFSRQVDLRLGIKRGRLLAAQPLSPEQKEAIVRRIQQVLNATVELTETLDESLIAGFRVELDGLVYDGSLRGRLERIKERVADAG